MSFFESAITLRIFIQLIPYLLFDHMYVICCLWNFFSWIPCIPIKSKIWTNKNMGDFVICIFLWIYQIEKSNILDSYEIHIDVYEKHDLHQMVRYKYPLHQITEKNGLFLKMGYFYENFFFTYFYQLSMYIVTKYFKIQKIIFLWAFYAEKIEKEKKSIFIRKSFSAQQLARRGGFISHFTTPCVRYLEMSKL
jgi:hypothetical protein